MLRCYLGGKFESDAKFRIDISKLLAGELAPLVCTKPYDALVVRNHEVEIEPADRHLDVSQAWREGGILSSSSSRGR